MSNSIGIVDLGGQYCHLIKRRLRELGVDADIFPPETSTDSFSKCAGIILSGGPRSVYEVDAPKMDSKILALQIPILGICYGHQLLAKMLGARVERGLGEYGPAELHLFTGDTLFAGTPTKQTVWMSHADSVTDLPRELQVLASTDRCQIASFAHQRRKLYGVQFHPEVVHTKYGKTILARFLSAACGLQIKPDEQSRIEPLVEQIGHKVQDRSVFFLVSGGVDSTVAFVLCSHALPKERILGLYVDTGLMRKGETDTLRVNLEKLGLLDRLRVENSAELFMRNLNGIIEPEEKRKIIGRLFVQIQSAAMKKYGIDERHWLLGQGTIYPDTIESGGKSGRAAVIKTHHNRSSEILELLEKGLVIEPLAEFYKDEVRRLGEILGLDSNLTDRWPFPGPGLAIRCLCTLAAGKAAHLSQSLADLVTGLGYCGVLLPLNSVGVQGDARTYRQLVAVQTKKTELNYATLQSLSTLLCNVHGVTNRVITLISGKAINLDSAAVIPAVLNPERIGLLREADFIVRTIMEKYNLIESVWQFPVVLAPISFIGGESIILRPVNSEDGMTADFARLPVNVIHRITEDISKLSKVDAVFLDVTSKPPATIEWE